MRQRGFTLLELLVALAVFAVAAALAWGGLDLLARSRQQLAAETAALADLQRSLQRFERDLRQAVPRPVRGESGGPALQGDGQRLELSVWLPTEGWNAGGPEVERIGWRCDAEGLRRIRWAGLDASPATPRSETLLLPGAGNCRLRYFPDRGLSSPRWPPAEAGDPLPRAVELQFERTQGGRVETFRRLIELPQAAVPQA